MTGKKRALGSNLKKLDAHVIQPEEYKEIPELSDAWFEKADLNKDGKLIRRGRPPGSGKKISTTVRFDADVIAHFRATGAGWQTRMNDALREWLKKHSSAGRPA